MQKKIGELFSKIQDLVVVQSIRFSLITLIPILMIGSFFLVAADLQLAMEKQELKLYYQPQYHADGTCIGAGGSSAG